MLLFNGSLHNHKDSFYSMVYRYVSEQCEDSGLPVNQIDLSEKRIPIFDPYDQTPSDDVHQIIEAFTKEDLQIWMAPLYHGTIPGVMKNALDWLQLTCDNSSPYLTDKKIGLICISDGTFGIQGINTMISIAHTLRAWVLPYSIPINKLDALSREKNQLASYYQDKIKLMVQLMKEESLKNAG
jgi:arsenic resistance protein ArsH